MYLFKIWLIYLHIDVDIYLFIFQIHATAGDILLAWTLGFVLSMLIESPMIAFEKIIFGTGNLVFINKVANKIATNLCDIS